MLVPAQIFCCFLVVGNACQRCLLFQYAQDLFQQGVSPKLVQVVLGVCRFFLIFMDLEFCNLMGRESYIPLKLSCGWLKSFFLKRGRDRPKLWQQFWAKF